jgi:transcriptional regulator with XRE-family HTH domain
MGTNDNTPKKNNPNFLRFIRESLNLSQEYVAAKLNISQQAYSRMENNPENITMGRLKQLAKILSVPLQTLVGEGDFYIQQHLNQTIPNVNSVMTVRGLADSEREIYEKRIEDLKNQLDVLNTFLLKFNL